MLWTREWQCSGCAYSFAVECGYGSSCPWVLVKTIKWREDATITLFAQGKWLAILDAGFQRAQGKQDPQPRPWTLLCLCEIPKTCTAPMPTSSAKPFASSAISQAAWVRDSSGTASNLTPRVPASVSPTINRLTTVLAKSSLHLLHAVSSGDAPCGHSHSNSLARPSSISHNVNGLPSVWPVGHGQGTPTAPCLSAISQVIHRRKC